MRRRIVAALGAALVFYALSDVLLWQRIFEANHTEAAFDSAYQTGHRAVLVGLIAVGVILLWDAGLWACWYALALYTLAQSGLEDMLYYLLDWRPIPAALPWLDTNPLIFPHPITQPGLLVSTTAWMTFWAVTFAAIPWAGVRLRRWRDAIARGRLALSRRPECVDHREETTR